MYSKRLERLTPYVPGEQPRDRRYIKLNTNENPYPPSPEVRELLRRYDPEHLRRYPDPLFSELRGVAGAQFGLGEEYVFAGNGSDEVLSFAFFAFFESAVTFADPTYSFYPVYCDFYGIHGQSVPLDADYIIDLDAILEAPLTDGVIIANPNSPTGAYLERTEIVSFLKRYPSDRVVVVDEAYIAFGGESCAPLVAEHENLVVVHTFSKSHSLAGLRLGIAFGSPYLIDGLFQTKDSFNSYPVHDLAQQIGVAALRDTTYTRTCTDRIITTRDRTASTLRERGWYVVPSKSNFLFARHPRLPGAELYTTLRDRGILIRHFAKPGLDEFVRITIGTETEMDTFLREAPA